MNIKYSIKMYINTRFINGRTNTYSFMNYAVMSHAGLQVMKKSVDKTVLIKMTFIIIPILCYIIMFCASSREKMCLQIL